MKAPDTIYIQEIKTGGDIVTSAVWFSIEEIDRVAYIRKDYLLEWARERASFYKQIDEDFGGDVFFGNRHAFMEMIDKINEL